MNNSSKEVELDLLRSWCDEFLDYVISKEQSGAVLKGFKLAVSKSYENKDLKAIRKIKAELEEWLCDLPLKARKEVEVILYRKTGIFGIGKSQNIHRVLSAGSISTDDEFRLLNNYIDVLLETDAEKNGQMIDTINAMLREYEQARATGAAPPE